MTLAIGVDHAIDCESAPCFERVRSRRVGPRRAVDANPGEPMLVTGSRRSEPRAARCRRSSPTAADEPSTGVSRAGSGRSRPPSGAAWDRFWDRADVTVEDSVRQPKVVLPCSRRARPLRPGSVSYNGRVSFGVIGDYDTMREVDWFCRHIETGIAELTRRSRFRDAGEPVVVGAARQAVS